ncbi:MAG: hypothetical protein ACKOA1_07890 [Bacteroidota bacterium]
MNERPFACASPKRVAWCGCHFIPYTLLMSCEEITQHLNKVATLYLKDNKRKVGWIFIEKEIGQDENLSEVCFISIQKGRKLTYALETGDVKALEPFREVIPVDEIERIRSTK